MPPVQPWHWGSAAQPGKGMHVLRECYSRSALLWGLRVEVYMKCCLHSVLKHSFASHTRWQHSLTQLSPKVSARCRLQLPPGQDCPDFASGEQVGDVQGISWGSELDGGPAPDLICAALWSFSSLPVIFLGILQLRTGSCDQRAGH